MSNGQIITRQDAEQEIKALIRADKRRGGVMGPAAVQFRRATAAQMARTAREWAARGEMDKAVTVIKAARAQLIIARGLQKYLNAK